MKTNNRKLSVLSLQEENQTYAGTGGVSNCNRGAGFIPAFLDPDSDIAYPSCFANGKPAPIHIFDGLPNSLVKRSIVTGKAYALQKQLVSGFLKNEKFYTRSEVARLLAVGN